MQNLETLQIEQNYYNNNNDDENILDLTSFVNPNLKEIYIQAVETALEAGHNHLSNYLFLLNWRSIVMSAKVQIKLEISKK